MSFVIYGANGYTGALTARLAVQRGMKPILAGRSLEKLKPLAVELGGLQTRAFSLEDVKGVDAGLAGTPLVLHCAGPFSHTYKAMSDACLRTGAHYLDITGEVAVFEALAARSKEALNANVMLMPGVGFDVVPSDCLAAHLKRRLPTADKLSLGFQGLGRISRGTAKTMAENVHRGTFVRENGKLVQLLQGPGRRVIDFGRGPVEAVNISWGDLSTAYHSTRIPNIEVFSVFPKSASKMMGWSKYFGWLLGSGPVQRMMKKRIEAGPPGPTDDERARGMSLLWGEAKDPTGKSVVSRLKGPEGYTLTALTSLAVVERVLNGEAKPGFQTPAMAFGPDFILEIPGVVRTDEP